MQCHDYFSTSLNILYPQGFVNTSSIKTWKVSIVEMKFKK